MISPVNSPDRFTDNEAKIFYSGKCCYQIGYGVTTPESEPGGMVYCNSPSVTGADFGYCRGHAFPDQAMEIEHVKMLLPVTEFWSGDNGCLLMDMADQTYIIRVDTDGSAATTYLASQPIDSLISVREDTYTSEDLPEITGWSAGWEC